MKKRTNRIRSTGRLKLRRSMLTVMLMTAYFTSSGQLITGTEGIHIVSGTVFTADGLWMVPSKDMKMTNTALTKHSLAISWPQVNGIRRIYGFSRPLSFTGSIGLHYADDELIGNDPAELGLAHSAGSSLDGVQFTLLEGSAVDPINRTVSHHLVNIPELLSLTAVTAGETPELAKGLVANTILSPDNDGINDFWVIENIEKYPNNVLRIFDRTGRILYQETGYKNTWDGTVNGRLLAEDTYYYILDYGPGKRRTGFISIVRKG